MPEQIFSKESLGQHYSTFQSQYFPQLNEKREIISEWIAELRSGKLNSLKEEEVKSRFVTAIFGEVLEFNCGNSRSWSLREEMKTRVDLTKPDAALGYFSKDKRLDDVRAIIEIKDANTELEDKQKRPGGKTTIDQAFEYASKMGGKCKWVIVSNFKEIRIYPSLDRSRYQQYKLEDLEDFDTLREFLFFFQHSRFIASGRKSKTDRYYEFVTEKIPSSLEQEHIVDAVYHSLKRFDGFGFVDPNYLASLYPFNILDEYVWHYDHGTLFTINPDLFYMMAGIDIVDGEVIVKAAYSKLLESSVDNYQDKITWIFKFLNNSNISQIDAIKDYQAVKKARSSTIGFSFTHSFYFEENEEGISKSIALKTPDSCDCISCNFRNFNFRRAFEKLKTARGDQYSYDNEIAYGNYLAANYKEAFNVYKYLDRYKYKEDKGIAYFLTKLNLKSLHNLIRNHYHLSDRDTVIKAIKSIDIDAIIHDELDFEIDNDVRQYLIQVKEDRLIGRIKNKIKTSNKSIEKLRRLYDNHGQQTGGLNLAQEIAEHYFELYLHDNRNFIIHDVFSDYQEMVKEVFEGLVNNFRTAKVGLPSFNAFFIKEAIIHIPSEDLKLVLGDSRTLKIDEKGLSELILGLETYLKSFYTQGAMAFDPHPCDLMTEFLLNDNLKQKLRRIFTNFFVILNGSELPDDILSSVEKPLLNFIRTENFLYWFNIEALANFIKKKGNLFSSKILQEVLEVVIARDKPNNNKYERLVESLCRALHQFYPELKIDNLGLVSKSIANCHSMSNGFINFKYYIFLLNVLDEPGRQQLIRAIDQSLEKELNIVVYEDLLRHRIYEYRYKDYFNHYTTSISKYSGGGVTFLNDEVEYSNVTLLNAALMCHNLDITLTSEQKELFTGLTEFDIWLLEPAVFNYDAFEPVWVKAVMHHTNFMKKLAFIEPIRLALEHKLREDFVQEYSDAYTKYFVGHKTVSEESPITNK
ncbi:hypothetical protein [Flavobacterium xinjiangense]|uniref:Uncharacterized protein n=1 Tax=Flavobacterium xinjiangense TaxID=178356 RepID=A0A1M7N4U5_9FLAO|nr:hypothetical protein [Flavobacterium xinjiangense]SHM98621.1 hypothetical protein SAMN05216269_11013 [Flavobacterium xinjiangense]